MKTSEIFVIPIESVFLFYAPLNRIAAVINQSALDEIICQLHGNTSSVAEVNSLFSLLQDATVALPEVPKGQITDPYFLGIIPTRDCNMACRYCGFQHDDKKIMSQKVAAQSVDAYIKMLLENNKTYGEIHFFGGEPFATPDLVKFLVTYAKNNATKNNINLYFEVSTNGFYSEDLATWISNNFDSVVLSLDGGVDIQNMHRPQKRGKPSFDRVYRSAKAFSEGKCEFIIRSCVSNINVNQLPVIAKWFATEFNLTNVCFEPLTTTTIAEMNELYSPEPISFVRNFLEATNVLEHHGIHTVLSTAELSQIQGSSCPVGKDALIVSPEGIINACYLLEKQWQEKGLDFFLGEVIESGFLLNEKAINRVRNFSYGAKSLCQNCFCQFHCAGGCHVNHNYNKSPGDFDDLCIRTRLISAALLLNQLGMHDLLDQWICNEENMMKTACQKSDRISGSIPVQ